MMKRFFLIAAVFFIVVSCSNDSGNKMVVTGSIDGLKKGTLFLQKLQDSLLINVDSLEIRGNGEFNFESEIESPEIYYLYLEKADNNDLNDRISFFAEKGQITIKTTWNQFEADANIKGSKSHDTFSEYQEMMSNFNKRDLELAQLAFMAGDTLNTDSIEDLAERNYKNRYRFLLNFSLTNPNSFVTPYVAITDGKEANPIYLDSIYSVLPDSIANSKYGRDLKKVLQSAD